MKFYWLLSLWIGSVVSYESRQPASELLLKYLPAQTTHENLNGDLQILKHQAFAKNLSAQEITKHVMDYQFKCVRYARIREIKTGSQLAVPVNNRFKSWEWCGIGKVYGCRQTINTAIAKIFTITLPFNNIEIKEINIKMMPKYQCSPHYDHFHCIYTDDYQQIKPLSLEVDNKIIPIKCIHFGKNQHCKINIVANKQIFLNFPHAVQPSSIEITWQLIDYVWQGNCGNIPKCCQIIKRQCLSSEQYFDNKKISLPCGQESLLVACNCQMNEYSKFCQHFPMIKQPQEKPFMLPSENSQTNDWLTIISPLAAIGMANWSINTVNPTVFAGKEVCCTEKIANYANCCTKHGWGIDIGLAHCNSEEKMLGKAREQGLVIELGRFCAKKILGVCAVYKQRACLFNNKLAKIIQQQGRQQLGKDYNCQGFTPKELSLLNFSQINWSEAYDDLYQQINLPSKNQIIKSLNTRFFQENSQ